jgi:hypothetical protein
LLHPRGRTGNSYPIKNYYTENDGKLHSNHRHKLLSEGTATIVRFFYHLTQMILLFFQNNSDGG